MTDLDNNSTEASEDDIASVIVAAQTSNSNICAAAILSKFIVLPRNRRETKDIVERLHLRSKSYGPVGLVKCFNEAATEIERLRAALAAITLHVGQPAGNIEDGA